MCCNVFQFGVVLCSVLRCSVAPRLTLLDELLKFNPAERLTAEQAHCVAVCRSVSQCTAVSWSVLQCVAVCCSVLQPAKNRECHRRVRVQRVREKSVRE